MELDPLRSLADSCPGPTHPEIDAQARAWLASANLQVSSGDGAPIVLIALAVDEGIQMQVFALPAEQLDAQAHRDLAAVHGAAFEHFFMSDLLPEQFAGALRLIGGRSDEPDVFDELVEEVQAESEVELDVDAIRETVGTWETFAVTSGQTLRGPISHVYVATLCM